METRLSRIKNRTWEIVGPTKEGDTASRAFDLFMTLLIALNVLAVMFDSVASVRKRWGYELDLFETISILIFSCEYLLSFWACTCDPRFKRPIVGRLRYAVSLLALFDLLAILPFFFTFLDLDLRFMRALRLLRTLRLFKAARYSGALRTLGRVIRSEKEPLITTMITLFVAVVMTASLMHFAEREAQPDSFGSIPHAMWWGISAMVKVPMGKVYPITLMGKVLASVLALMGVALFALPAGILSSAFVRDLKQRKATMTVRCPHCNRPIPTADPTDPADPVDPLTY